MIEVAFAIPPSPIYTHRPSLPLLPSRVSDPPSINSPHVPLPPPSPPNRPPPLPKPPPVPPPPAQAPQTARLARLSLSDSQAAAYQTQLSSILAHMDTL